jgi:hypothetical protein
MQLSTKSFFSHRFSTNTLSPNAPKIRPRYNLISRASSPDRMMDKNEILLSLAESPRNHDFLQAILSDDSYALHGHVTINALDKYSTTFEYISSSKHFGYSRKYDAVKDLLNQFNALSDPLNLVDKQIDLLSNRKLRVSLKLATELLNEIHKNQPDFQDFLLNEKILASSSLLENAGPYYLGQLFMNAILNDQTDFLDKMLHSKPFLENTDPEWLSLGLKKIIYLEKTVLFDKLLDSIDYLKNAGPIDLGWAFKVAVEKNKPAHYVTKMLKSSLFIERARPFPLINAFKFAVEKGKTEIVDEMLSSTAFKRKVDQYLDEDFKKCLLAESQLIQCSERLRV